MNILINATNIKKGGGIQVTDSICRELHLFPQHQFTVVLSNSLRGTGDAIERDSNVSVYYYDIVGSARKLLLGRDKYLDDLEDKHGIEAVLTIFGPSLWKPKCEHLCGFARAQMVIKESPFYTRMNKRTLFLQRLRYGIREKAFKKCADYFYTENPYISERLEKQWRDKKVFTVTNYYNQVFDHPEQWKDKKLSDFDGITLLTIATPYAHKNLVIAADVARILRQQYPYFCFRFVMSNKPDEFPADISGIEDCFEFIGRVDISECPSLYQQCDIVFQPTLLECFTAAYPEAMRMERPIVTTDLVFAKGLCGEAAEYYSAIDPQACADAIFRVATNKDLRKCLVKKGKDQLKVFDNYELRAEKLIKIIESLV